MRSSSSCRCRWRQLGTPDRGPTFGGRHQASLPATRTSAPLTCPSHIDPSPDATAAATCPYSEVGWDSIIVRPPPNCPVPNPADVIVIVNANAKQHLQHYERGKLMRLGTKDGVSGVKVSGDTIIGEIIATNAVLIPFAIDHLGGLGPMAQNFLFEERPAVDLDFPASRPNAKRMYEMAMNPPCPTG
ncbi:hypothetical protein ACHAWF_000570, partial [Thalassiosira exigua]